MSLANAPLNKVLSQHVELVTSGQVIIREVNETGEGKVQFDILDCVICIRHAANKPPLRWLSNQKCSDGAIVNLVDDEIHLHLIELKKTVTHGKWNDIKLQFDGMLHNCIAILAVLGLSSPHKVQCHIAYEGERISPLRTNNPIFLKSAVGKHGTLGCLQEWMREVIDLQYTKKVKLHKIERDSVNSTGFGALY